MTHHRKFVGAEARLISWFESDLSVYRQSLDVLQARPDSPANRQAIQQLSETIRNLETVISQGIAPFCPRVPVTKEDYASFE